MHYRIIMVCLFMWVHSLGAISALRKKQEWVAQEQKNAAGANQNSISRYNELAQKSNEFHNTICKFPTSNNRIAAIAGTDQSKKAHIAEQATDVHVIMHAKVREQLIPDFLAYKKTHGSAVEKNLYNTMTVDGFINRLLVNRPMMFMNSSDDYLLRNKQSGSGGFENIGKDHEKAPLVLKDYLSYEEMQIAALIGVSVPTYFINDGSRQNSAQKGAANTYEEEGVYVGLVGARFEKPGLMEWQHIVITPSQNTQANGYEVATPSLLRVWEKFYGETFLQSTSNKEQSDRMIYCTRLRMVIEPFLMEANQRGAIAGKEVYCHVVGLGLGVWKRFGEQEEIMLNTYAQIIQENNFAHIADIDFSYFSLKVCAEVKDGQKLNNITLHFSARNPAAKLTGVDANKLLVAMYAWDGNAYPGNEYWMGSLTASGDPAAACCSAISELQNPLINDALLKSENHIAYDSFAS